MKNLNFKDIIGVAKNYSSLLLPFVLLLVCAAVFAANLVISGNLRGMIAKESIPKGNKIKSMLTSVVPADQWKEEEKYQNAYAEDANQIALLAKQSTQRELLSYRVFPEPKDTSVLIFKGFGKQFCDKMDKLILNMNARDCPTAAEIGQGPDSEEGGARSISYNRDDSNFAIREAYCRARAELASVYANPADLSGYEFWQQYKYAGMDEAVKDCWYSQLACWIIEDVADTIISANDGSKTVYTSKVKRLMNIRFSAGAKTTRTSTVGGWDNRPKYVVAATDGLIEPYTGRLSNEDIDVVHFIVSIVVDNRAVLPFIQQLCSAKQHKFRGFSGDAQEQTLKHNQITVLESSISPVNRDDGVHGLYRYGDDAVVTLDLICEYIFYKSGYEEIEPAVVKG